MPAAERGSCLWGFGKLTWALGLFRGFSWERVHWNSKYEVQERWLRDTAEQLDTLVVPMLCCVWLGSQVDASSQRCRSRGELMCLGRKTKLTLTHSTGRAGPGWRFHRENGAQTWGKERARSVTTCPRPPRIPSASQPHPLALSRCRRKPSSPNLVNIS